MQFSRYALPGDRRRRSSQKDSRGSPDRRNDPDPDWGPSKLNSMSPAPVSRAAMNPYAERKTLPREGHRESQGVDVCSRASDSPAGPVTRGRGNSTGDGVSPGALRDHAVAP